MAAPSPDHIGQQLRIWAQRLDSTGFAGIENLGLVRSSDYTAEELADALRRAADTLEIDHRFTQLVASVASDPATTAHRRCAPGLP